MLFKNIRFARSQYNGYSTITINNKGDDKIIGEEHKQ